VPSLLRVGSSPYLRPLAELQDEYGTLAVVAADNTSTQIHLVHVDDSRVEGRVRGDVKNAVKKGGWSQKRYARRREKQLERYADEVVEVLADLDRKHGFKRIVMVGSTECLQEIEKRMPQPLRERSHRHDALDPHQGDGAVIEAGWEQWFAVERAEEQQLWEEIRNEALGHGLAALGATEVLGALNASRVAHLLVDREASIKGTRCRACEHVVHGTPETCQACGAAGVFAIDLVDELVRLAELTSAEVEFADPIPALSEEDGVAALLRY
jgi:peptide subunit release factor 1 (eRF1)